LKVCKQTLPLCGNIFFSIFCIPAHVRTYIGRFVHKGHCDQSFVNCTLTFLW
jgi:hypothetical protein